MLNNNNASDHMIKQIYGTLVGSCQWSDVLEGLCTLLDSSGTVLIDHNFGNRKGHIRVKCDHLDDAAVEVYQAKMCARDPWLHSDLPFQTESVFLSTEIVPESELVGTEFYQDYLSRWGLKHRLCGVIRRDGHNARFLAIARGPKQRSFGEEDKAKLRGVLSHLRLSFDLRKQLRAERSEREALLAVLDHIPIVCMLVNKSAKVHYVNNAAEQLLGRDDGLMTRVGCLSSSSSRQTSQLRSAIAKVSTDEHAARGEHFVIARPSRKPPLLLTLFAIQRAGLAYPDPHEPVVAVLAKDPDGEHLESLNCFAQAYGLTQAEARLIRPLADGLGLFEAAHKLGITKNTARTHMRHIYAKSGVHRQAELIQLLARVGAA